MSSEKLAIVPARDRQGESASGVYSALATTSDERYSINDLEFTDLYFSATGDVFLRGCLDAPDEPLSRLPAELLSDIESVRKIVIARSEQGTRGKEADSYFMDYSGVRYRVTCIPEMNGNWFTLRRSLNTVPELGTLLFPKRAMGELAHIGRTHGMIVLAGRTGDGKTTTCYSLLQEYLRAFGGPAVTIENPPELQMSGPVGNYGHCFQVQVENGDFTSALKRALRITPRYIMVGEILARDEAQEVLRASINGHVVLTTIHAGSVQEAIQSLLKLSIDATTDIGFARHTLSQGIAAVIHQKLVATEDQGVIKRVPQASFLFMGDENSAPRQRLREGKIEQLANEIAQQEMRMSQNKPPIDRTK